MKEGEKFILLETGEPPRYGDCTLLIGQQVSEEDLTKLYREYQEWYRNEYCGGRHSGPLAPDPTRPKFRSFLESLLERDEIRLPDANDPLVEWNEEEVIYG